MTKNTTAQLRRIFELVLSISILLAGICLISACLTIYYSGNGYSPEAVRQAFGTVAVPVWVCIGLTFVGFVAELILPLPRKSKVQKNNFFALARVLERKDTSGCEPALLEAIGKERKKRTLLSALQLVLTAVCFGIFLVYALNGSNFHSSEINGSMIRAMWVLIPTLAVPFAFSVFVAFAKEKSYGKEAQLLKSAPDTEKANEDGSHGIKSSERAALAVKLILVAIGVAALVYGALAGGTADVLAKAVNICTECIGLG